MFHTILYFQDAPAATPEGGINPLFLIGAFVLVFYFFMLRPQMKKQKAEKKFQSDIEKGAWVVTTSGIHGKVVEIADTHAVVETGAGKIKFERTALSSEHTKLRYGKEKTTPPPAKAEKK